MIEDLSVVKVFNSRGEETVKVYAHTDAGTFSSIAPGGASKSSFEPVYLPWREIEKIFPEVKKRLAGRKEEEADRILQKIGGRRFGKIGGNLAIAISQACWKSLWSTEREKSIFPVPLSNVIGGGAHGGFTSIQEFLVFPKRAKTMEDAIATNVAIWKEIKSIAAARGYYGKNDEGAIVLRESEEKCLELLSGIAERYDASIGVDVAATQFYERGAYSFSERKYKREEFVDKIAELITTYGIKYVEDPFHERDFESFAELTRKFGKRVIVCGDDLYSTNYLRLKRGAERKASSGIIIKPNQAGTVSLALKAVELARKNNIVPVASHRSGESEDWFIAEFALRACCPLLKCSVSGSERFAKWNYLMEKWERVEKARMARI